MGSHFAKHLSPLVLASEREMSFDSVGATAIFRRVAVVGPQSGLFYVGSTWWGDSHRIKGCWKLFQGTSGGSRHSQPWAGIAPVKVSSGPRNYAGDISPGWM